MSIVIYPLKKKYYIRNGLSSILDLVDRSNASRKLLFSPEAWIASPFNPSQNLSLSFYPCHLYRPPFKIDIRVVFTSPGNDIDIVSGEIAKNDEGTKVTTDEGKLSRETKDAVDSILTLLETKAQAFSAQISGSTCLLATQQLIGNGLYVYHPSYRFSLPYCIEELESFKLIMQQLLTFQTHVIAIANNFERR